jgi:hypothetical protein
MRENPRAGGWTGPNVQGAETMANENEIIVGCSYRVADVTALFPSFEGPDREDLPIKAHWTLSVTSGDCDGVLVVVLDGKLRLTLGAEEARRIGAELIRLADVEDAKLGR